MKEAMKNISNLGEYQFSDAFATQGILRFDNHKTYAQQLHKNFIGKRTTWEEVMKYTLNKTPLKSPKKMLRHLEKNNMIEVITPPRIKRRKTTFPEDIVQKIIIYFREEKNATKD